MDLYASQTLPSEFKYSLEDLKQNFTAHRGKKHSSIISVRRSIEQGIPIYLESLYDNFPIKHGMAIIAKSSLPIILANWSLYLLNTVNLFNVGQMNDTVESGGFGVGMVLVQCTVYALMLSINQGLTVLGSHAFGAKEYYTVGLLYLRANLLHAILIVALLPFLFSAKSILMFINISPEVAQTAETYILHLIPSFIGFFLYDSTKAYLLCLRKFHPIVYIQVTTFILHIFWSDFFTNYLGLGVKGAAIARGITDWSNFLLALGYIKKYEYQDPVFKMTWIEWTRETLNIKGLVEMVKYIVGLSSIYFIQQFTYYIFMMLAGQFNAVNLVAHTAMANTNSIHFCIPLGISLATMTYISGALGEGSISKAKFFLKCGYYCILVSITVVISAFLLMKHIWISLFSSDRHVHAILEQLFYIFIIGVVPWDSLQALSASMLKSIGKQLETNIIIFTAYYLFAIPLAVYWGFAKNMQTRGIWYAIAISDITMFIFGSLTLWKTDWDAQMKEIKRRVAEEQGDELMELRIESGKSSVMSESELKAALLKRKNMPERHGRIINELNLDRKEIMKLFAENHPLN